jgi:hypothetical protein
MKEGREGGREGRKEVWKFGCKTRADGGNIKEEGRKEGTKVGQR